MVLNQRKLKDTTVHIDFLKSKRTIKAMVCAQNNFCIEYINALLVYHTREKRIKLLSSYKEGHQIEALHDWIDQDISSLFIG